MTSKEFEDAEVPITKLLLDPNNLRFHDEPEFVAADQTRFAEESVQTRAFARIRQEGIGELKSSILTNGFLTVERLVVRPYLATGKLLVVEGNRRLAALRSIQADYEAGVPVPKRVVDVLQAVPVLVMNAEDSDAAFLAIMGIRHVGGIKQWGGYQRANLIRTLKDEYDQDTPEVAARLGLLTNEVTRRYRAIKALEQMRESDEFGDSAGPSLYPIFHEAMAVPLVRDWLKWDDKENKFVDAGALTRFYSLISPIDAGDDGDIVAPKIPTYIQVRELRQILPNDDAVRVLLDPSRTFADALAVVQVESLTRTWKSQVVEAVTALSSVSALEVAKLGQSEIDLLERVSRVALELVKTNSLVAGK